MSDWSNVVRLLEEARNGPSRRRFLSAASAAGLAAVAASVAPPVRAAEGKKVNIKFGYTATQTNPVAIGYEHFKNTVNAKSNNAIAVATFCCNQLGSDLDLIQGAQSGALQMGTSSNNNLDQFTSKIMVVELPYLLRSRTAYRKFWQSAAGQAIHHDFEHKLGLKIVMVMDAGGRRGIETVTKKVRRPGDLKGLKLRIANTPIEEATFKIWGANPIPMAYNQVFTALQQKTVDGEVLQPLWFYTDKHQEVAKNICNIHYISLVHIGVMNLAFFKALPKDYQELIMSAGKEAEDFEWKLAGEANEKAIKALKATPGIDFYEPTGAVLQEWESTSRPVWNEFAAKIGPALIKQVDALN